MDDAFLESLSVELSVNDIHIRNHYTLPHIFDHMVKFHYAGRRPNVLVVGSRLDTYYGVHVRNILREECGILAPLIDIQMLPRVHAADFDDVLICYNRAQVEPHLAGWEPPAGASIVYMDELITQYHWLFAVAERMQGVYSLRDIVRGLLRQPVEEARALQFNAWTALARDLRGRAAAPDNLFIVGSGAGMLPTMLKDIARNTVVYESEPLYLNNLALMRDASGAVVKHRNRLLEDLEAASGSDNCVVFCETVNRAAEPAELGPLLQRAGNCYFTCFLSCDTKPQRPAIFRAIADRNVAFGREDRRDLRCLGAMPWIWLPRENALADLLGTDSFQPVYTNNEFFARAEEYASGYAVLRVAG